jgi:L-cysteine/cystine lyase
MLYLEPEFGRRVRTTMPGYLAFEDPGRGLDSPLRTEARRFEGALPREALALSLAATEMLLGAGLDDVMARAAGLARRFADALAEAGRTVVPRGSTTLVAWEDPDPAETRLRLAEAGVAVRNLPGTPYLRASVGAWNDESDLERLLAGL